MFSDLAIGVEAFRRGLGLMRAPGLRRYVLGPLLVNLVVFTAGIWALVAWLDPTVESWVSALPGWLSWLEAVIWLLVTAAVLVVGIFAFTLLANLIGIPFNGLLAEKVAAHLGRELGEPPPFFSMLVSDLWATARRIVRFLLWWLAIVFLLGAIPGLNVAVPLALAALSAWMLGEEYADPAFEVRGMGHGARREVLSRQRMRNLGFGGAALAMSLIPVLNFIVMPAAVAGAVVLWVPEGARTGATRGDRV